MAVTDHGHAHDTAVASDPRADVVRRARRLNVATIGWNGTEGVVAVLAGHRGRARSASSASGSTPPSRCRPP